MKIIFFILFSVSIFASSSLVPDINLSSVKKQNKGAKLLEKIEAKPILVPEKKEKELQIKVDVKKLEKEIKNSEIKANNNLIEIKTIIADGYLNKDDYSLIIEKLKSVEINDFSKSFQDRINKISSKKSKKKLNILLSKLKNKYSDLKELKEQLISELIEKLKSEKTFIEEFKINKIIDFIDNKYDIENKYLDPGKFTVFFSLFILFLISGIIFNKIIRKFLFLMCKIKDDDVEDREELESDIKIIKFPIFFLFLSIGFQIGFEILSYPEPINDNLDLFFTILNIVNIIVILIRSVDIVFFIGIKKDFIKIKRLELINLFTRIIKVIIAIIGIFYILTLFGFDTNKLIASLGIGSLAIAYATKDFISRFFSGLKLILDNSFSAGDWVKISSIEAQGVIVDIGFMNTTIRTFDNALLVVPNSIITNESYINWNRRRIGRKIGMKIGVKYNSKISDIRQAIKEIKEMLSENLNIAPISANFDKKRVSSGKLVAIGNELGLKNTLFVNLSEFGDSAIIIDIYAFSKSVDWGDWRQTKEDVMFNIMEIIENNNLEFAFPSQSIYFENSINKEDIDNG